MKPCGLIKISVLVQITLQEESRQLNSSTAEEPGAAGMGGSRCSEDWPMQHMHRCSSGSTFQSILKQTPDRAVIKEIDL